MVSRSPLALGALAAGTFALGMTEFVITGLLPEIAAEFSVSIPTAGLLISGYALSVVIGGPVLTAVVAGRRRKPVLIALLGLFVVGNLMSAVASGFGLMMAGRVVAALCHGSFIGIATIVAGDLVRPDRRSSAIAAMLSGITIANVAGVPLGTFLGQQLGWRATFWAMALLGLAAALAVAAFIPAREAPSGARPQWAAFRDSRVWLALGMTALAFGAVYAPFTYVAPLMTEVAGFGSGAMPWLLVLFGFGLVLGNVIGARAADHRLMTTIVVASVAMLVVLVLFAFTSHARGPAAVTLFALGVVSYATVPGLTTRVITAADSDAQNLIVSSAAVSAFNLGNAAGAFLGGRAIAAGWGYDATPLVGAAMEVGALVLAGVLVLTTRMRQTGRSVEVT
ncbi:MFS transporter [Actinoplanes bogorensis]|uniref:MFS transporter n=1 Tax=Paractinoplanes bogorensis TaxID=1610840 RepID=A0ABS5YVN5_9ACTN|nr:MFS transporter [Actinoplanes bogorensis]MBU2667509.1 MFS transporter [Actinoplanes bogorensis]